jgi:hypothetical protein
MSRRKTILYGGSLDLKFNTLLGFSEYDRIGDILEDIEFEVPKIDWKCVEERCDQQVS